MKIPAELMEKLKNCGNGIFLIESPANNYQPEPPKGYIGMRSHTYRIFVKLNPDGTIPKVIPSDIEKIKL